MKVVYGVWCLGEFDEGMFASEELARDYIRRACRNSAAERDFCIAEYPIYTTEEPYLDDYQY